MTTRQARILFLSYFSEGERSPCGIVDLHRDQTGENLFRFMGGAMTAFRKAGIVELTWKIGARNLYRITETGKELLSELTKAEAEDVAFLERLKITATAKEAT